MIADSDAEVRQRLHARLLEHCIHSDCVNSVAEALRRLNEWHYAVVVADLGLSDGAVHLVSRIAALDRAERPIVLVLAPTAEAARGLDVEIVQIVIRRPVEIGQLIDLIRSCLRNSATLGTRDRPDGEGLRRQPTS